MDITSYTPQEWIEDEENLLKQLEDESVWNKIPLLNANEVHNLQDGRLVRFRGMVQDMHNPEYYLEKFEVVNDQTKSTDVRNGKYCDAALTNDGEHVNFTSSSTVTSSRRSYVVISIPGLNDWVKEIEERQFKLVENEDRHRDKCLKRAFDDIMDINDSEPTVSTYNNTQKKICTHLDDKSKNTHRLLSKDSILNFPIPNPDGKACHLKLYTDSDEPSVNEVCEFVGFLSIDPLIETAYEDDNHERQMELEVLHPPSSLVPRIHCVHFKNLKHNNPLIGTNETIDKQFNFLRKELLIVLTQILLGDELAAEYLIYHLISEIYMRRDHMPLGKFSLNISNIPSFEDHDFVEELYKFIEMLVPKSYYLPMTLENMNDLCFIPKKDYECQRLTSGILQLSNNTHVVLDETKLSPGTLNASGIENVRALVSTIKMQLMKYDFNYFKIDFKCDIPFLILSEGKSMLNSDVHVILQPQPVYMETFSEILEAARHFLKPELLNDIRKYLTLVRLVKYEINAEAEEFIQRDFINMRQESSFTGDDLHRLLVLARLVCISEGKTVLDEESWKKACRLEKERKSRSSN